MMKIYKLLRNVLIYVSVIIFIIAGKESLAEKTNLKAKGLNSTSLKSFTKQIYRNFGPSYTSHVEELYEILFKSKKTDIPADSSFLEFDVLKLKVVENKTIAIRIDNGDVVHNKDKCKISFTPRRYCFIYIFKIGTTGVITPLFPLKKFSRQRNPMMANLTYFVPPMKKWLAFEKGYGKEAIIIFASTKRNTDIERLMEYFDDPKTLDQISRQENVKPLKKIPIINKGTGKVRKSETRKARLPFDEFGEFTSTEFEWVGRDILITLWYKRK